MQTCARQSNARKTRQRKGNTAWIFPKKLTTVTIPFVRAVPPFGVAFLDLLPERV
jgi:hypothetical protein